jgi:hypothetical protein
MNASSRRSGSIGPPDPRLVDQHPLQDRRGGDVELPPDDQSGPATAARDVDAERLRPFIAGADGHHGSDRSLDWMTGWVVRSGRELAA